MPLKMTSMPHSLLYIQPSQNGGRLIFWSGYKESKRISPSKTSCLHNRLPLHSSLNTYKNKNSLLHISLIQIKIYSLYDMTRSRGSSGSIVSDYGLDNRAIEVRSAAGAEDFSSNLCVQTGSGAHPASCTMGTGGPSPGLKRGRGVMLTTHPHLVPRS
jgi:hypothetical protein